MYQSFLRVKIFLFQTKYLQKECSFFYFLRSLKHHLHTLSLSKLHRFFKYYLNAPKMPKMSSFSSEIFHQGCSLISFSIYFLITVNFNVKLFLPARTFTISQNLRHSLRMEQLVVTKYFTLGSAHKLLILDDSLIASIFLLQLVKQERQNSTVDEQVVMSWLIYWPFTISNRVVNIIESILNCSLCTVLFILSKILSQLGLPPIFSCIFQAQLCHPRSQHSWMIACISLVQMLPISDFILQVCDIRFQSSKSSSEFWLLRSDSSLIFLISCAWFCNFAYHSYRLSSFRTFSRSR